MCILGDSKVVKLINLVIRQHVLMNGCKVFVKNPELNALPVTDEMIRWHLLGRDDKGNDFVMGIYPMLLNETCFFLTADFDKSSWQKDAIAFLKTCRQMNLPAALERSRSGKVKTRGINLTQLLLLKNIRRHKPGNLLLVKRCHMKSSNSR
jgi:hypothetical protein